MDINKQLLQTDTLRYKKNKLPANLALIGLLFNLLYFCILYGFKSPSDSSGNSSWFTTILIGGSVILTLVMLLANFLASEGIKNYKKHFCIVLIVLAIIQVARIFIYPLYVLQHSEFTLTYFWIRTTTSTFPGIMMIIWLCASAASLIASAVTGYINCVRLEKHIEAINTGKLDVDQLFKSDKEELIVNGTEADELTIIAKEGD